MALDHHRLQGRITVVSDAGTFLEQTRVRLLEAIDECGSITKAAKHVPLSYKTAWDAIDAMSKMAGRPLVDRTVGGAGGGGSHLTDYGRRLVAFYRALEREYQVAIAELASHVDDVAPEANFRYLLRRQSMRTCTLNPCPVLQPDHIALTEFATHVSRP